MAFKLTYTDGQADDYDDSTKWEVDDGVLKMGRKEGEWTVLVSPSHWATIEVRSEKEDDERKDKSEDKDKSEENDKSEDKDKSEEDEDEKDDDGDDDDN